MAGNPWIAFVKKGWPAAKKRGLSYSAHLKASAGKYKKKAAVKKGGRLKAKKLEEELLEEKPKRKKRKKKRST